MSAFSTVGQLCSWAGLVPQNNENAEKNNAENSCWSYTKPLLVQNAVIVSTSEKHPDIRNRYIALRKRHGHKKAIIAIA